jgi:hypothetical protein
MSFSKPTERHSSTKIFRRAEIFAGKIFSEHDSQPHATRLSSVKDVTATHKVQTRPRFFPRNETSVKTRLHGNNRTLSNRGRKLTTENTENREPRRTENCPLPLSLPVIYTYRLP